MFRSDSIRRLFTLRFGRRRTVASRCAVLAVLILLGSGFRAEAAWRFSRPRTESIVSSALPTESPDAGAIPDVFTSEDAPLVTASDSVVPETLIPEPVSPSTQADPCSCGATEFDSLCGGSCCDVDFGPYWSSFEDGRTTGQFIWNDLRAGGHELWGDIDGLFEWRNMAFLGAGLGVSLALRSEVDGDVREWSAEHPERWGSGSDILNHVGHVEVQVPVLLSLYGLALHFENEDLMRFSRLAIRTYAVTGLATILVKAVADTDRPSDEWLSGRWGFPSGHAATSFALAATVEEYYGPQYGIPAYVLAGLIAFSRIDQQDHDLSDVVFGAVLGYAIGKSIAGRELRGDSRIQFFPWVNPSDGSGGLLMEYRY